MRGKLHSHVGVVLTGMILRMTGWERATGFIIRVGICCDGRTFLCIWRDIRICGRQEGFADWCGGSFLAVGRKAIAATLTLRVIVVVVGGVWRIISGEAGADMMLMVLWSLGVLEFTRWHQTEIDIMWNIWDDFWHPMDVFLGSIFTTALMVWSQR